MPLDEEGREPRGIDAKPKGIMGFVETHGPLVLGVFAALAAGYYLLTSGKGSGATTISQPQPSGGGGQSGGGGAPSNPTVSGYLPYSPDTSILQHLSDTVLEGLYNQLFNAEAGANLAYSQGNESLFNQFQDTIKNLQNQIAAYVPATPANPVLPKTPAASAANNNAATWQQTLTHITTAFGGMSDNFTQINIGSPFATGWITTVSQVFNVPAEVAQNLYSAIVQNPSYFRPAGVTGGSQWDYQKIADTLQGQLDIYNSQHGGGQSASTSALIPIRPLVGQQAPASQIQALGLPRTKRIPNV